MLDLQFLTKDLLLYTHSKEPVDSKRDGFLRATLNIKQVKRMK